MASLMLCVVNGKTGFTDQWQDPHDNAPACMLAKQYSPYLFMINKSHVLLVDMQFHFD